MDRPFLATWKNIYNDISVVFIMSQLTLLKTWSLSLFSNTENRSRHVLFSFRIIFLLIWICLFTFQKIVSFYSLRRLTFLFLVQKVVTLILYCLTLLTKYLWNVLSQVLTIVFKYLLTCLSSWAVVAARKKKKRKFYLSQKKFLHQELMIKRIDE